MRFDRQIFFEQYRRQFGAIKHQYVVDGLTRLLNGFETYWGWWDDLRQIANAFAQVGWETAWSYTPVVEGYYLGDPSKPGYFSGNTPTVINFQKRLRYYPHFGRGDIQLTWAENYRDQDARIRKWFPERVSDFESRTGKKFDLINDPAQTLDPWISFCIFTIGMHIGTFRGGHNLDRYITPSKTDHFGARDIVNGDKNYIKSGKKIGIHIKETAERFETILKAARLPDQTQPVPKFSEPEINDLVENLGPPASDPPNLAPPDALPFGDAATELTEVLAVETSAPAGDPPDEQVPDGRVLKVEDWKPFVVRWLKRVWGLIPGVGIPGSGAVGFAALQDPDHWHIYAAAFGVVFLLLIGFVLLCTIVLISILFWNRKEIVHYITEQWRARMDPEKSNFALEFEKK